jgi:hypothetical protein
MSEKHVSTTALARMLHKESKELFILLAQGGWMVKVDNHWQLTEKGKFEGGIYINHPKYGEYIAWPEAIQDHPLLKLLPIAPLSATHLGAKLNLPSRFMNLCLAERGWIKKNVRGWLLTSRGKALGGEQHVSEQSGIPFVTWPETLLENSQLLALVAQVTGAAFTESSMSLSGRTMGSSLHLVIENWLYLAGVHHACGYELGFAQDFVKVDFFIPEFQIAVDLWSGEENAAALSRHLEKQTFYTKNNYEFIELHAETFLKESVGAHENVSQITVGAIDEFLAKQLLVLGLAVY